MDDTFLYKRGVEKLSKFLPIKKIKKIKKSKKKIYLIYDDKESKMFAPSLKKDEVVDRVLITISLMIHYIKYNKYKNAFMCSRSLEYILYLLSDGGGIDYSDIHMAFLYLRLFIDIQLLKIILLNEESIKIKHWLDPYLCEEILSAYDLFCDIKAKLAKLINKKICMNYLSGLEGLKNLQSKLEIYYKYTFSNSTP